MNISRKKKDHNDWKKKIYSINKSETSTLLGEHQQLNIHSDR